MTSDDANERTGAGNDTQTAGPAFRKYARFGAYHWKVFSRDARCHDLLTDARYRAVLDSAGIQDGMSVLDLGSGDGALTYMLCRRNPNGQTTGVEPDPTGSTLAAEMLEKRHTPARSLDSLAFVADRSQDVVVCADVIEHVVDTRAFLADMRRVLRPGGRAVISTPVRLSEFTQAKEHVREYFPEEFRRLVAEFLYVTKHTFCTSIFALDLYDWCPRVFLRKPVFRWFMSLTNIWFGRNLLYTFNPTGKYWLTQIVVASRPLRPDASE